MAAKHQMHGKSFENIIKACGLFSHAASDRKRGPGGPFDISAGDDLNFGYPTSIKSTKGNAAALSDARAFWQSFDEAPYRVLVCKYGQTGDVKACREIHEFIFQKEHRAVFFGEVTYDEVAGFHESIGLTHFPKGRHMEARKAARNIKSGLMERLGILILNQKIDSGTQRRLQCSVKIKSLMERFGKPDVGYRLHTESIGDVLLPLRIRSTPREFNN